MAPPDRRAYGARQAALLESLMRGDGYPAGVSPVAADTAGQALRRKRARAVRRAWPALAAALAADFDRRFDVFARATPLPTQGGGRADGLVFASTLGGADHALTEDVRVELMLARAVLRGGRAGSPVRRRRGPFAAGMRLRDPARLLLIVRIPGLGRRLLSLPLGR